MKAIEIEHALKGNKYPGRGVIMGLSGDGLNAVAAYFIMGRSVNSRNRVFREDGRDIRTQIRDPEKLIDPSLILYAPVREIDGGLIISNGDQTDTVFDYVSTGRRFEDALRTREYEPDAPNYTPRISAYMRLNGKDVSYTLSILKKNAASDGCDRFFYQYERPAPGVGHLIHTYMRDASPLPSFEGEPIPLLLDGGPEETAVRLWDSLDRENRISLFVRYICLETGNARTRVINKYE